MTLGFFFSRNMSVRKWKDLGLLDRERLIYEKHIESANLEKIYWFTYGANDNEFSKDLNKNIVIVPMPRIFNFKFGSNIYSFLLPFIQKKYINNCDILKTDQMDGSWSAVLAKILFKKKLLVRTGFTLSLFMKQKKAKVKSFIACCMEVIAYKFCDFATVSSNVAKKYIIENYGLSNENVKVVYNYIDTKLFKPENKKVEKDRLLFIGRFDNQKNIQNLMKAVKDLDIGLDLYGDGNLKEELELLAKKLKIDASFLGKVANKDMPKIFNKYEYYVLPSLYEGMPKTLLEAMSCGLVCIGTDTLGINEVIEDKKNGFLIYGYDPESIKIGILNAFNYEESSKIKVSARNTILNKFSLEQYAIIESEIFNKLIM